MSNRKIKPFTGFFFQITGTVQKMNQFGFFVLFCFFLPWLAQNILIFITLAVPFICLQRCDIGVSQLPAFFVAWHKGAEISGREKFCFVIMWCPPSTHLSHKNIFGARCCLQLQSHRTKPGSVVNFKKHRPHLLETCSKKTFSSVISGKPNV